jgi:hypothetical protein
MLWFISFFLEFQGCNSLANERNGFQFEIVLDPGQKKKKQKEKKGAFVHFFKPLKRFMYK